jgi:hypothetical protein
MANGFNGLYHRGKISPLGHSFGGFGLMSGVVCKEAFYYTYSFGSGVHRSQIGKLQVVDGQLKRWDSGGFEDNDGVDLFVDKVDENSIRVFSGEFREFNRWETGKEFGRIEEANTSHLKVIGRDGRAIATSRPLIPKLSALGSRPPRKTRFQVLVNSPGRAFHPQGSAERFPVCVLTPFPPFGWNVKTKIKTIVLRRAACLPATRE